MSAASEKALSRYHSLRSQGLCGQCGAVETPMACCAACATKSRARCRSRNAFLLSNRLCAGCKSAIEKKGSRYCEACKAAMRTVQAAMRAGWRAAGLCGRCGRQPKVRGTLCECTKRQTSRRRQLSP